MKLWNSKIFQNFYGNYGKMAKKIMEKLWNSKISKKNMDKLWNFKISKKNYG